MEQELDLKSYIINESDRLFCQYGFKSVTMDDIAKHLGMSKKTIYQHFSDKDELVNILIESRLTNQDCVIHESVEKSKDAVHELLLTLTTMNESLGNLNPKMFYDLQKYHPKAWLHFRNFKEKSMGKAIYENLDRGIREGIYRSDIQKDILTQLRLDHVEIIFNHHDHYTMMKYNLAQVMIEITTHFLYGVCNDKGVALIASYKEELKNTQ